MTDSCPLCGLLHPAATPCLTVQLPVATGGAQLQPLTLLAGRYRIIRTIHRGGMSVVYLAEDVLLQRPAIALKELRPLDGATAAEIHEAEAWFARESALLSDLRHPLIPQFYSVFREHGRSYIAQEYVQGENLDQLVARQGPVEEYLVAAWGFALCGLLHHLHGLPEAVIFRDLKPANILLRASDNTLRVVDFGIARTYQRGTVNTVIGTPGYAPPEQYQGLATPQSDIYALGATLHRLLTGYDPEQGAPFTFPPVRQLNFKVSVEMGTLVERATRLNPVERLASTVEFGGALNGIIQQTKSVPAERTPQPAYTHKGNLRLLFAIALLAMLAPLAALVVREGSQSQSTTMTELPPTPSSQCAAYTPSDYGIFANDITRGPGGNVWFAIGMRKQIGYITPTGQATLCNVQISSFSLNSITLGPDGNIWATEADGNEIARITPSGNVVQVPVPGCTADISTGPDGNLWCTEYGQDALARITPQLAVTSFPLPSGDTGYLPYMNNGYGGSGHGPTNITASSDGKLWFTDVRSNQIGRMMPDGSATDYTFDYSTAEAPGPITATPDGRVWFAESRRIGRITHNSHITWLAIPDAIGEIHDLIAGSDGSLWYTAENKSIVGYLSPGGTFSPFSLPSGHIAQSICTGWDGNYWFTTRNGTIGRITPGGHIAEFP